MRPRHERRATVRACGSSAEAACLSAAEIVVCQWQQLHLIPSWVHTHVDSCHNGWHVPGFTSIPNGLSLLKDGRGAHPWGGCLCARTARPLDRRASLHNQAALELVVLVREQRALYHYAL